MVLEIGHDNVALRIVVAFIAGLPAGEPATAFGCMLATDEYTESKVKQLFKENVAPPEQPSLPLMRRLMEHQVEDEPPRPMPEWAARVAGSRDHFQDTVFLMKHDGLFQAWKN